MTYVEGFIVPVPATNRDAYLEHARDAWTVFKDLGIRRHVEAWEEDVKAGKHTDFRRAVQARDDEKIVFAWFEYPDRASRDQANGAMMSDPRMEELGKSIPFDGKRMVYGGFSSIVGLGAPGGDYVDGFVVPVPDANRAAYVSLANRAWEDFKAHGALRLVEAWADDVPEGEVTDFRRAVAAESGEAVVFSWIEWPSKAVRDGAWAKMMEDPSMKPGEMPFDGKRMFWGGFERIVDAAAMEVENG